MVKKRLKVLFLGVTGRIGFGLIEEYLNNYKNSYDVILGIRKKGKNYGLKTRKVNLGNISSLKKAMKGIDVVVNLAANADPSASFSEVLEPNIIGSYNVFQAAKVHGVFLASFYQTGSSFLESSL